MYVNTLTGAWYCHRCGSKGLLLEWHTEREPTVRRSNFTAAPAVERPRGTVQEMRAATEHDVAACWTMIDQMRMDDMYVEDLASALAMWEFVNDVA